MAINPERINQITANYSKELELLLELSNIMLPVAFFLFLIIYFYHNHLANSRHANWVDFQLRRHDELLNRVESQHQALTSTLNNSINHIQSELTKYEEYSNKNLEKIRQTVDEKLHGTLEQKLGDSFKQVVEKLALVHRGLGEMQNLANGVGDLKKTLTNVKTRGIWGEFQLETIMQEILAPHQFQKNFQIKANSNERVDFAIKLPVSNGEDELWIPVDSKFPIEDYRRLINAEELQEIQSAQKALQSALKNACKSIATKYIKPPKTTDFAILFVPIEGLFAEIMRMQDLVEELHQKHRIIICGPTTFAALLNSLQIGFRSVTIQERTSEVWKMLGLVRNEFNKFGEVLDGVRKKLNLATNQMDDVGRRSKAIEKRLRQIESIDGNINLNEIDALEMIENS